MKEKIKTPHITVEQFREVLLNFRNIDTNSISGKQKIIDTFINAIYLYDDKITFTFNYKDGTKTVFLSELNCTPSGSDLKCLGAPEKERFYKRPFSLFFRLLLVSYLLMC